MAVQIIKINKRSDKIYSVTVQDTAQQIGVNDLGDPIYKTYTETHNTNLTAEDLKHRLEERIRADLAAIKELDTITVEVKPAVESIDTSALDKEVG